MCTYLTERLVLEGSAKSGERWTPVDSASVYFDHPVHANAEHSVNLDFFGDGQPGRDGARARRVALELTPAAARELAAAIERVLASAPARILAG
ncbi:MAG TPA: DUF6295 family protein [Acidothermaceae bacterium]|jgi:hypothetical protein